MANINLDRFFSALADPTRREVFERLRRQPKSVGALADGLPVSRSAVSQHLKVLNDAGLVVVRAEGTRRIYAVQPEALEALREWLDGFWEDVLASFAEEVDTLGKPDHERS